MAPDPEQERLSRLRDGQLAARDPRVKQRRLQQDYSRKSKAYAGQRLSLGSMWKEIPHIYRSGFVGLVVGLLIVWQLPQVWVSFLAIYVAVGAAIGILLVSLLVGRSLDIRDNIRDLSK